MAHEVGSRDLELSTLLVLLDRLLSKDTKGKPDADWSQRKNDLGVFGEICRHRKLDLDFDVPMEFGSSNM